MRIWQDHVLPRLVDRTCATAELDALREAACRGLAGDVVEIGFGSGLNVPFYPAAVRSVAAVEPSDLAWRLAARRVATSPVTVRRAGLDGERLDLPDASFDHALSTFTMCTVPDLDRALAELRRVLRPGGRLHFAEHGLAPDAGVARWQRRLNPVQRRVAGGCTLDRAILERLVRAGFDPDEVDRFYGRGPRPLVAFSVGSAGLA